jgi:hypothetical protein
MSATKVELAPKGKVARFRHRSRSLDCADRFFCTTSGMALKSTGGCKVEKPRKPGESSKASDESPTAIESQASCAS